MEQQIISINAALEAGRNLTIPGIVGRGAILWAKCDRPAIMARNQIVEG